jgi:hypothetical protein
VIGIGLRSIRELTARTFDNQWLYNSMTSSMTSIAACVLCGKGPVDSEVDSSEDDDDTLCSKLEIYKCAAHPLDLYFVFCCILPGLQRS